MSLIHEIENVIKPPIEAKGCGLYEVSLVVERGEKYLRILLEKPGTRIDMNLIVELTRELSALLDQHPLLNERYILDVSSAGIDYTIDIEKLPRYIGSIIQIFIDPTKEGKPGIIGQLLRVDDVTLTLSIKTKDSRIEQTFQTNDLTRVQAAREDK